MTAPALTLRAACAVLALLLAACGKSDIPPVPEDIAPPPESAAPATPSGPRQFPTVLAVFEEMNDYTPDVGTLAIESLDPLRLRISPTIMAGEDPRIVRESVRRAVVYAVLRVFIHTDAQSLQVTAQPALLNMQRGTPQFGERTLLAQPRASVSVTRAQVEKLVKDMTGADLPAMIGREIIGGHFDPDTWSELGLRLNYNDQGPPGLVKFSDALGLEWQPQPKGKNP